MLSGVANVEAAGVDRDDVQKLRHAIAATPSGETSIGRFLQACLDCVADGHDVTAANSDQELSPQAAADVLGMSRPTFYKVLDSGEIPFREVGTHRRVAIRDLLDFAERRRAAKAELAESVAHIDRATDAVRAGIAEKLAAKRKAAQKG
jgi:excisionase family DNA binding protein